METICFCNRKGGSCKTTSAMAFADALALKGEKVLVVDMDSQFGATATYNIIDTVDAENRYSLYDIIVGGVPITKAILHVDETYFTDERVDYGKNVSKEQRSFLKAENKPERFRFGVDIIPSDVRVGEKLKSELNMNIEKQLLIALADLPKGSYDYVILDTIPGEDSILYNALVAADDVIVTLPLDEEAYSGMQKIQNILDAFKKNKMGEFHIGGILITNVDLVTSKSENLLQYNKLEAFCQDKGINIFNSIIRRHPGIVALKSDHVTIFNKKVVKSKVLENGSLSDDEPLTVDSLKGIKKTYTKNSRGNAKTIDRIDYTSVAKDYLRFVDEYLQIKEAK